MIELLTQQYLPSTIKVITTAINEPVHHVHGEAPFISVNNQNIVRRPQLGDFLSHVLGVDLMRKGEFVCVAGLCE